MNGFKNDFGAWASLTNNRWCVFQRALKSIPHLARFEQKDLHGSYGFWDPRFKTFSRLFTKIILSFFRLTVTK